MTIDTCVICGKTMTSGELKIVNMYGSIEGRIDVDCYAAVIKAAKDLRQIIDEEEDNDQLQRV